MYILYVEDESADAQLVERYLQLTPHQFVITSTLQEAQTAMQSGPDLILVDILLNHSKSGYAFVRELREQGCTKPIIAVTGLGLVRDIEQCYEVGFTDVLVKPYAIKQLAELVNKYENN